MRLIEPVTERLPRSRLWLDDLRQIVEIMQSVDSQVSIRTDKYILDRVDELRSVQEDKLKEFAVRSHDGRIRLYLGARAAKLVVVDPDHETLGMAVEIADVVKRRRAYTFMLRPIAYVVFVSMILTLTILGVAAYFLRQDIPWSNLAPDLVIAVLVYGSTLPMVISLSPRVVMYTRTRAERPPWFERNRDALITNAPVSIVSLILGALLNELLS